MKELIKKNKPVIQVEMNDYRIKDFLYQLGYSAYQVVRKSLVPIETVKEVKGDLIFLKTL